MSASRGSYCSEISGSCLQSWEGLLTMLGFFFPVPERVPAGKRPLAIFICLFVFFLYRWCVYGSGVIRHIIGCQRPCSFRSRVHRWTEGCAGTLTANVAVLLCGNLKAEGVYRQPFTPPPFM